jgi:hypothetical protein
MNRTPAALYDQIRDYHPTDILQYLADKEGISPTEASERWDEMLKFLVLAVTSDLTHAPSDLVDTAWHAFLLHTERYEEFCLTHLGRFVHHQPKPEPLAEYANNIAEIFTSFPTSPIRRHLWLSEGDCVGECAEKGCRRVMAQRTEPLPSVVAMSGA